MHIFEKLPQTLGLCPIVNFRSDPRKSDPQTFGGPPQPKNPACITETYYIIKKITLIQKFSQCPIVET